MDLTFASITDSIPLELVMDDDGESPQILFRNDRGDYMLGTFRNENMYYEDEPARIVISQDGRDSYTYPLDDFISYTVLPS